jgi:hypothetical protein
METVKTLVWWAAAFYLLAPLVIVGSLVLVSLVWSLVRGWK